MGKISHHAIIVTSWNRKDVLAAKIKAARIFKKHFSDFGLRAQCYSTYLITKITPSVCNQQYTFFIGPDGSKEGWPQSDAGDAAREEFIEYLKEKKICEYIEVQFGGDNDINKITNSN